MNEKENNQIGVYFLGSGQIGVPILLSLADAADINLLGIGTQPDRRSGRRKQFHATPIAQAAQAAGLAQPDKPVSVNEPAFVDKLERVAPELIVVVSFGQILKRRILELPSQGCLNVHASLLPRHRGASPIAHAILEGDHETGISFMAMEEGLDSGPVFKQIPVKLYGTETAPELEKTLSTVAAEHIVPTISEACRGGADPVQQDETAATYAPKLHKCHGRIDWLASAERLEKHVRAYQPWPGAWFELPTQKGNRRIQVTAAEPLDAEIEEAPPGTCIEAGSEGIVILCGVEALRIHRLIPAGKREMTAPEFVRGGTIKEGTVCC